MGEDESKNVHKETTGNRNLERRLNCISEIPPFPPQHSTVRNYRRTFNFLAVAQKAILQTTPLNNIPLLLFVGQMWMWTIVTSPEIKLQKLVFSHFKGSEHAAGEVIREKQFGVDLYSAKVFPILNWCLMTWIFSRIWVFLLQRMRFVGSCIEMKMVDWRY